MTLRKRKIVFGCFAVLFGFAAGLGATEMLLRLYPPEWLVKRRESLNLTRPGLKFGNTVGWSVEKIDGKFVRFVPRTSFAVQYFEYDTHVNIDRWGGRVVNGNTDRQFGPLVPFLGDSFAFGIGVNDDQTFISHLQRLNTKLQFVDLGVPGCALPQQIEIIKFRHKELGSPKIYVFAFYTGNDYADLWHYYGATEQGKRANERPRLLRSLDSAIYNYAALRRLYLIEYVQQLLTNYYYDPRGEAPARQRTPWLERSPNGKTLGDPVLLLGKRSRMFTELSQSFVKQTLERLQQLASQAQFTPVFLIIPDKTQVDRAVLQKKGEHYALNVSSIDVRIPQQLLAQELERRKIAYFDLMNCLYGHPGYYYEMDDHWTPAGHAAASKCMGENLNRLLNALASKR